MYIHSYIFPKPEHPPRNDLRRVLVQIVRAQPHCLPLPLCSRVSGFGFRVWGLGFRV